MGEISIIVRLKAPDPAAVTAHETLKRISPEMVPVMLQRFDHWSFTGPDVDRTLVEETVSHYTDIVNPNKQTWTFFTGIRNEDLDDTGLTWTGVLVTDLVDSVSENWSGIISGKNPGVTAVSYSVLWMMGFQRDLDREECYRRTDQIAVTRFRDHGLLANPVSQMIEILGRSEN
jgi:hypothetical protein